MDFGAITKLNMLNAYTVVIGLYLYSLVINYKTGKRPEKDQNQVVMALL